MGTIMRNGRAYGMGSTTDIIADVYDGTVQYVVGDYCIHNNVFYKCTTNTTGTWDSTKWDAINVSEELDELESDVNDAATASGTSYDNTTSGLTATDVQDAIDELAQGSGPTYTEGDGIDISNNEISVDTTFTEASTRANIASGDSFSTILGKIKKFFTELKTVAFSGSYDDLSDKPTIPAAQVSSDWNASSGVTKILNKPSLATVATSGSYNDLTNKPDLTELVWIGDSFSTGFQFNLPNLSKPIPTLVAEMLRLNLHNYGVNGSGFTIGGDGGVKFINEANSAVADTSFDHTKVKYVVVLGGINDVNNNPSGNMRDASIQLFKKLGDEFRNAVLYYIPNWAGVSIPDAQEKIFASAGLISDGDIGSNGFVYARNNLTALMGRTDLVSSDNIHPNQAGAYHMAGVIYQLINGSTTNAGKPITLISNNNWDISGLNMYKSADMIRIFGHAVAKSNVTPSTITICEIPPEGTFAGTFYQICPSKFGASACTVEIAPSVALTSAPANGTIKMFHDHGSTIYGNENVLINILIPLLNE